MLFLMANSQASGIFFAFLLFASIFILIKILWANNDNRKALPWVGVFILIVISAIAVTTTSAPTPNNQIAIGVPR